MADATTSMPPALERGAETSRPFVLVTGASEGIGLAIARLYAARGNNVLMIARSAVALARALDALQALGKGDIRALAVDLTDATAIGQIDGALAEFNGHIAVLVNNAGLGLCGPFTDATSAEIEGLIQLNVTVPLKLMRHVLVDMQTRGTGGIINIASVAGYVPGPYQAAYYASKAALVSASRAIGAEVRQHGVRVTVVSPGPVETRFHGKMHAEMALYRRLLPAATAEGVARRAVLGHELGLQLVLPNFVSVMGYICCRVIPDAVLVPIMAWLLHPRDRTETGVGEDV
ncbi:MAG: SDR family NAD(P)-dependent oxidoreductase [Hyphomicrobiaceae bacterium]